MTKSFAPSAVTRTFNTLVAAALGAFILAVYWPLVQLLDLSRADLEYQGYWIGGHTKQITAVTPGGVADRAGLREGDVLEFDPATDAKLDPGELSRDARRIQRDPTGAPRRRLQNGRSARSRAREISAVAERSARIAGSAECVDDRDPARGIGRLGAPRPYGLEPGAGNDRYCPPCAFEHPLSCLRSRSSSQSDPGHGTV